MPKLLLQILHRSLNHFICLVCGLGLIATLMTGGSPLSAEDSPTRGKFASAVSKLTGDTYQFRVLDDAGKPVSGAMVAVSAVLNLAQSGEWTSPELTHTNEKGLAKLSPDETLLDESMIVVWHPKKRLGAIINPFELDPDELNKIQLEPLKSIQGEVASSELTKLGRQTGMARVDLTYDDRRIMTIVGPNTPLNFSFPVPNGEYDIQAMTENTLSSQNTIAITDEIKTGLNASMDLIPTRIALLSGTQAPALTDIAVWKNSQPLTLEELKGNVVILDFWGYWCGPCVASMPAMMKLHDQYHKQGLRIIAVHVDSEDGKVVTTTELDRRVARVKKSLWKDRDLPFPVALTKINKVPYGPGIDMEALNQVTADYGVMVFPTGVLINRRGEVVKNFSHHNPEDLELVRQLLGEGTTAEVPVQKTSAVRRVK